MEFLMTDGSWSGLLQFLAMVLMLTPVAILKDEGTFKREPKDTIPAPTAPPLPPVEPPKTLDLLAGAQTYVPPAPSPSRASTSPSAAAGAANEPPSVSSPTAALPNVVAEGPQTPVQGTFSRPGEGRAHQIDPAAGRMSGVGPPEPVRARFGRINPRTGQIEQFEPGQDQRRALAPGLSVAGAAPLATGDVGTGSVGAVGTGTGQLGGQPGSEDEIARRVAAQLARRG